MSMIVVRIVDGVQTHFRLRLPEWMLTSATIVVGITFLQPGDTFELSTAYALMASIASDTIWGLAFLIVSLLRLAALMLNGTFRPFKRFSPYARSACAFISAVMWMGMSFSIMAVAKSAPGAWVYFVLMVYDLVNASLIAKEAGQAEKEHRDYAANASS